MLFSTWADWAVGKMSVVFDVVVVEYHHTVCLEKGNRVEESRWIACTRMALSRPYVKNT